MEIGELVGAGRTADVFALDDGRVLRRYPGGDDATGEIAVMAYLAERGFPVPAVWPGTAAGELVMQRLSGMTMVEALVNGAITAERAGEVPAGCCGVCMPSRRASPQTPGIGSCTWTSIQRTSC